jgi:rare lipoprotein A (peptidoglycan hydrolase)
MLFFTHLIISLFLSTAPTDKTSCVATWYDTSRHPRVHRHYSTAAYCDWKHLNKKFVVTNIQNGKSDTVVITDRHPNGPNHIDLSKSSFGKLANHAQGKIIVKITELK